MKRSPLTAYAVSALIILAGIGIAIWNAISTSSVLAISVSPVPAVGTVASCTDLPVRGGGYSQVCQVRYFSSTGQHNISVTTQPGANLGTGQSIPIDYQQGNPANAATTAAVKNAGSDSAGGYALAAVICVLGGATAIQMGVRSRQKGL